MKMDIFFGSQCRWVTISSFKHGHEPLSCSGNEGLQLQWITL